MSNFERDFYHWRRTKDRKRGPMLKWQREHNYCKGWTEAERLDDALRYFEQTEENEPPTFTRRSW